jgi:hypothetical protein
MPYELVYVSLATRPHPPFVAELVRKARIKNRSLGVTGLLVFDGHRFCQLLEGEPDPVGMLAQTIETDPRHCGFTVLYTGLRQVARRFPGWDLAFGFYDSDSIGELVRRNTGAQLADILQATPPARIDSGQA